MGGVDVGTTGVDVLRRVELTRTETGLPLVVIIGVVVRDAIPVLRMGSSRVRASRAVGIPSVSDEVTDRVDGRRVTSDGAGEECSRASFP